MSNAQPIAVHPPVLRTSRLLLEPLSAAHSAGMFHLWSSAEVCAHSGDAVDRAGKLLELPARTPATSDRIIDVFEHRAAAGTGLRWAVLADAFVGAVGFNSLGAAPELAYHQRPDFWGRGYMREACGAAIDWVAARGARRVVAYIERGNHRSVRLAEALGFEGQAGERDGAQHFVLDLPVA